MPGGEKIKKTWFFGFAHFFLRSNKRKLRPENVMRHFICSLVIFRDDEDVAVPERGFLPECEIKFIHKKFPLKIGASVRILFNSAIIQNNVYQFATICCADDRDLSTL